VNAATNAAAKGGSKAAAMPATRLESRLAGLRAQGRKALVTYVAGGDPSAAITVPLLHALAQAGADVIELGVPFSDPMADGPVIQRAAERGIRNGFGLRACLQAAHEFRATDAVTPLVLMGYANPIERMGQGAFVQAAAAAGVDGALVVDYPPEECGEFAAQLRGAGLSPIFLLSPTSTPARIARVSAQAGGFIYYVSLKGITGAGHLDVSSVAAQLPAIRAATGLPIAVGFGVRDGATARALAQVADGVVVGSRLIEAMEQAGEGGAIAAASALVREIRTALDA
jgi:tryptophan synthase alpha chain